MCLCRLIPVHSDVMIRMMLLKVEDQMKLLESSWSELLLLDLLYRQLSHADTHQLLMVTTSVII